MSKSTFPQLTEMSIDDLVKMLGLYARVPERSLDETDRKFIIAIQDEIKYRESGS